MRKISLITILIGVGVFWLAINPGAALAQEQLVHTVQAGETLDDIAARYDVSRVAILSANGLTGPNDIQPGQQLFIPDHLPVKDNAPDVQTYTVQFDDTLSSIAARFDVDIDLLISANNIADPNRIAYGQELVIPALGRGGGSPQPPLSTAAGGANGPVIATYIVREGETLRDIAMRFGMSEAALAQANGITAPGQFDYIRVLRVPLVGSGGGSSEPAAIAQSSPPAQNFGTGGPITTMPASTGAPVVPPYDAYIVQTGDTLSGIAARFGVSTEALAIANRIANPGYIQIGQMLYVPGPASTWPVKTYVVRTGDTLYSIAMRFGVSLQALAAANRIANPGYIQIGQVLVIP